MRLVCGVVWCIDASDEEARRRWSLSCPSRSRWMHGVGRMPIAALNSAFDGLYGPGDQWYARADFVREIPDEAIERNREWNVKMPTFKSGSHVYPIDGAVHDVAPEDTAFSFRDATWSQVFIGVDADPAQAATLKEWTIAHGRRYPYSAGGAYVNFMMDEGQARVKATYGPNYERLAQAKRTYDADNVFRVNQNILPAAWAAGLGRQRARQRRAVRLPDIGRPRVARLRQLSKRAVVGSEDSLGSQAQGEVTDDRGQVSRTVAAMGLLLHPRDPGLAPLLVAGQRPIEG